MGFFIGTDRSRRTYGELFHKLVSAAFALYPAFETYYIYLFFGRGLRNPGYFYRIGTGIKKGVESLGSQITDKSVQVTFLKQRLNMFMELLEAMNPEEMDLEDVDRLISILDGMESKCREFHNREL